jgi:hypothetical protein
MIDSKFRRMACGTFYDDVAKRWYWTQIFFGGDPFATRMLGLMEEEMGKSRELVAKLKEK